MARVLIVGGSGFVGRHVAKAALSRGLRVACVSRRGTPSSSESDLAQVEWMKGDMHVATDAQKSLEGIDAVISCLGGFGTNEAMRKLNGDANAALAKAAAEANVKKFVYVSAPSSRLLERFGPIGYGWPVWWPFGPGYWEGKRIAEAAIQQQFGSEGVCVRPGPVYGPTLEALRLWKMPSFVGVPMEWFLSLRFMRKVASMLGGLGDMMCPPVAVEALSKAIVAQIADIDATSSGGSKGSVKVLEWESIVEASQNFIKPSPAEVTLMWNCVNPTRQRERTYHKRFEDTRLIDQVDADCNSRTPVSQGGIVATTLLKIHAANLELLRVAP